MKSVYSAASILQLQDFCRTCLKEVDVKINIFRYMLEDGVLVSEALKASLPIEVEEDDKLPQQMCSDCVVSLSQTYAFVNKCLQAQEVLHSCLNVIDSSESNNSSTEELITIINENEIEDVAGSVEEPKIEKKEICSDEDVTVFTCHMCSEEFANRHDLVVHLNIHNQINKSFLRCHTCSKTFDSKGSLYKHQLTHDCTKDFICSVCGKAFVQHIQLEDHLKTHADSTKSKCLMCEQCGSSYKTERLLLRHIASHTDHSSNKRKKENIKKQHNDTTPFLCQDCGKYLKTKMALKLHMRIHTGEKPHVCVDCGRRFSQGSSLIYHKRIHTGEKPYTCRVCFKNFVQPAHLKTHMKTHTGEKPFSCPFCGKNFALKKNMIVHSRIHTGEKPYACSLCDMKFVDASSRKKHFKGHVMKQMEGRLRMPMYVIKSEI